MMMNRMGRLAVVLFLFFYAFQSFGQHATETFGRNRIQYKDFDWKYLSSENFDVYFYGSRGKLAREALQYLELEFDRITDLLGYYPYQKTKVFLYNSIADLQQSNVGLNHTRYNVSGETEFIKPYVEIAHPGNLEEFKDELVFKLANLYVNEMMFGGSLRDAFTNSVLLNLPSWFIDGTSYYVAYGWSEKMDDYVRQLVKAKKINRAFRSTGTEAALAGQSVWNYIVERYGKSSINNILNYTRIIRNEEKSILITLGVPFRQLMVDWKNFYKLNEEGVEKHFSGLPDSVQFTRQGFKKMTYTTVKISPDGKSVAYAENDRGRFVVKIKSLENGSESVVLTGGNRIIKQTVDYRVPLLSWADATTLGVIGLKDGQYVFWLYDLKTKTKIPRDLDKFSNIRSFSFSNNGRLLIVSADFEGQNDLFLLSSRRDRTKRLTRDAYDDLDPSFIPNSNTIVFSSNRVSDSLSTDEKLLQKLSPYYNLFLYNIDTTTNRLIRVTRTLSKDFHPLAMDEHNVFYLSDQRGIVNLFRYNFNTKMYTQVTGYDAGIKDYDIHFDDRKLALITIQNLKENIFLFKHFDLDHQVFTSPTRRKELLLARNLIERKKKEPTRPLTIKDLINARNKPATDTAAHKEPTKPMTLKDLINSRLKEHADTAKHQQKDQSKEKLSAPDSVHQAKHPVEINTENYSFDDEPKPVNQPSVKITGQPTAVPSQKTVSTDDYVFEDEAVKQKNTSQPNETFLTRYMKARELNKVTGPFPYEGKFSYDNLITNVVIDQLRGWSLRLETQMNDMLENFRFNGGFQVSISDLKSGDVWGEFHYLPKRLDFSARFDRKVIYWQTKNSDIVGYSENQKYSFQKVELGVSYPFSVRTRFSLKPFLGYTEFLDRGYTSTSSSSTPSTTFFPTVRQAYGGARAELIYDNSVVSGLNIIEGTRGKISAITYNAFGNKRLNFSQVYADVRHYQKIYHEIVFAVRGYAGSFFGNAPKSYLLGGVDNWAFNNTNYTGSTNPLNNAPTAYNNQLLFVDFASSLRGFDYATQYGSSVAMANAEIRVPIVRALASGPISSSFFRNLQLTGFYDIGSAWTGFIPIGSANNGSVREVSTPPVFTAYIKEYLNPWLYSYGAGFRSMIFGYYLKMDLAWPVVNYQVQTPRLQASLGFDF
ncbi:MAG: PD40 domain-containing protein [Bacteroidetes bacterium]|nr:PD40 domain-containing protein [Bacteroidota bacterium]MBS1539343.1 PD40 domain-containing protein [Bacteroidota bacterium]